eukprot:gnl/MRDRNA2_/MRDRNA2_126812_c0_seq1.p1 gnl/MRDRNA2_/MRDRNA2_126812_c0~~gnl/MRDRNA2_/MRDRNA2_126812_c0_seq1.p1  ORF type:complete len:326 (+),score=45.19 gnl/MRDRNA2_/MRDRNA2_126812_c0_seq1:122-1099(+)
MSIAIVAVLVSTCQWSSMALRRLSNPVPAEFLRDTSNATFHDIQSVSDAISDFESMSADLEASDNGKPRDFDHVNTKLVHFGWDQPTPRNRTRRETREWGDRTKARVRLMQKLPSNMSLLLYGDSLVELLAGTVIWGNDRDVFDREIKKRYGPRYVHASGVGGDQLQNLLYRLKHGEGPENAHPRSIMLLIGTNNIMRTYFDNDHITVKQQVQATFEAYKKVVKQLQLASPKSIIILNGIFPRSREWGSANPSLIEQSIVSVNKLIKGLAHKSTIRYAGCENVILDPKNGHIKEKMVRPDHIHPSELGFQRWAKCVQPTLDQILL